MRAHTLFESPNQIKQGDQLIHLLLQNRFYYRHKNENQLILLLEYVKDMSFEERIIIPFLKVRFSSYSLYNNKSIQTCIALKDVWQH